MPFFSFVAITFFCLFGVNSILLLYFCSRHTHQIENTDTIISPHNTAYTNMHIWTNKQNVSHKFKMYKFILLTFMAGQKKISNLNLSYQQQENRISFISKNGAFLSFTSIFVLIVNFLRFLFSAVCSLINPEECDLFRRRLCKLYMCNFWCYSKGTKRTELAAIEHEWTGIASRENNNEIADTTRTTPFLIHISFDLNRIKLFVYRYIHRCFFLVFFVFFCFPASFNCRISTLK